jgi:hypothetical protein
VLESHLERWLSGFSAVPRVEALRRLAVEVCGDVRPRREERRRAKAARTLLALRHAFTPLAEHEQRLLAEES